MFRKRQSRSHRLATTFSEALESRCLLSATVFESGDIGYFVDADAPQIQRYDITNEQWLTPITLAGATGPATAAHIDADGIYAAFGKAVYRFDLQGQGQTHLLNAQQNVIAIHSDGGLLFLNHTSGTYARFVSINKATNTIIDTFENYVDSVYGSSIAPGVNRIFGRTAGISPSDITYVAYEENGEFINGAGSPYHGDFPSASETWVFPGGAKVVDNSGTIYATDNLSHLNNFADSITDIEFFGRDVPIVLSGSKLVAYTSGILPTGEVTLDHSPSEIFINGSNVVTFTADSSATTGYATNIVPLTSLNAPTPGAPVDPVGLPYTPDAIEIAADGTMLLFSKSHQSIFRWNPLTQSYSESIPLIGTPDFMAYSASSNTAYLAYHSGLIRQIDLADATLSEIPFIDLGGVPIGLSIADPYIFAVGPSGYSGNNYTFAADGTQIDAADTRYYSTEYVWNDANQKMYYFRDATSPNDLLSEEINADGATYPSEPMGGIGVRRDSPRHSSAGFTHPIRVAPDGSVVVLGSGVIHDATTLERLTYSLSNTIVDAAWLSGQLFTARNVGGASQFQRWSQPTYGLDHVVQSSDIAHSLTAISDTELLGITLDADGVPIFTVMNANLEPVAAPYATGIVYVNDDFTQSTGTIIADADPNTTGNQPAMIGVNAFSTIQAGIDAVDVGGRVKITDDLSTDGPGFYFEHITIAKEMTILGSEGDSSAVIIDGASTGRVVLIDKANATIHSVTIQNGASVAGAGIFNVQGVMTIANTIIKDNVAADYGGGFVNAAGGVAYVDGVLIENNVAGGNGGGIVNAGLLIVRNDSTISNNTASGAAATQGGGGIFNDKGRLAIQAGTTISGNVANGAAGSGGGIFSTNGVVTIDDSTITGNSAVRGGGGIEFVTGTVELRNTQLDDNDALGGGASAPGNGGGLHVTGRIGQVGYIRIFGGTVSGNIAATQGGGLWNQQGNIMVIRNGAVIDDNAASGDAASDGGGGIFNRGGRLAIAEAAVISRNTAGGVAGSGGGLFSTGSGVSIEGGVTMSGNSANRAGGGIEIIDGLLTIVDSTIESNNAGLTGTPNPGNGGAIHVTGTNFTRVDLRNSIVRFNSAYGEGGALWNQTNGVMLVRAGTQVTTNYAEDGGGIFNQGGRLVIHDATIDDNSATDGGGGVFTRAGVTTIENTTVSNNKANRAGGGVEIVDGWIFTRNMDLVGNNASGSFPGPGDGGGLHVAGNNLTRVTIEGGTITGNSAAHEGGGLWHQSGSIMVILGGTTISENTASGDAADEGGGGIFNNGGRLAITAATLSGNSADGTNAAGGGILSLDGGLTLDNTTVSGNTANGDGGGVISHGELITANATIVLNRSNADGNSTGTGGGIHNAGLATLKNTIVAGNLTGTGSTPSDLAGTDLRPGSAHNLIGDAASSGGLTHGAAGNIIGNAGVGIIPLAAILNPTLADNGGPTLTHALATTSPAINTGNSSLAKDAAGFPLNYDQRGFGFRRTKNTTTDIGAFEV